MEREEELKKLKEQLEERNKKLSDTCVNMDANVKFKEPRKKLQGRNKQLKNEKAYLLDIFKEL